MNSINSNASAGMKVSYSKLTNEFKFTATETGANSKIEFGGLGKALFVSGEHSANDSFAETYGFGMSDGESKRIAFGFDSYDLSFVISSDDTIQDIADYLNESIYNDGWTASYDELSGQLKITDKTGKLVAIKNVNDSNDLMIINQSGVTLRLPVSSVRVMGRATQGVKLIELSRRGDTIASVCKVDSEPEEEVAEEDMTEVSQETLSPDMQGEVAQDISGEAVE